MSNAFFNDRLPAKSKRPDFVREQGARYLRVKNEVKDGRSKTKTRGLFAELS